MKGFRPRGLRFLLACTSIATSFFAPGCHFKNPGYPQHWPQLKKSGDESHPVTAHGCPDISGRYWNLGIDSKGGKTIKLDSAFLWGDWFHLCYGGADSVDVSYQPDSSVLLRGIRDGSVCDEKALNYEKDYWCSEEGLEVRKYETVTDRAAIAKDWITKRRTFRKAGDGSLVLNDTSSGRGVSAYMIVPVPYAYGEAVWYRFEAIEEVQQNDKGR